MFAFRRTIDVLNAYVLGHDASAVRLTAMMMQTEEYAECHIEERVFLCT